MPFGLIGPTLAPRQSTFVYEINSPLLMCLRSDNEYEKLWKTFDGSSQGSITQEALLAHFRAEIRADDTTGAVIG
jgi:hypothetical protein